LHLDADGNFRRPPEPDVGAFGEKLRKQREQRGLDLDAISKTTKISIRMLRAIEDEHFDQLPGGVFNKGFVRAYARQVGLDEDEAVADYLTALRESQQQSVLADVRSAAPKPSAAAAREPGEVALADGADISKDTSNKDGAHQLDPRSQDPTKHGRRDEDRRHQDRRSTDRRNEDRRNEDRRNEARRHPNKFQKYPAGDPAERADESSAPIPWGKLALTLVLLTLVLALWNFRRRAEPVPASQPVPFSSQSPAATSAPALASNQPSSTSSLTPGPAPPAGTPPPGKSSPAISAATTPPTEPASATASPTASATGSASKPAAEPDANPPAAIATAPAAAAKPPATFTLLIRAEKTTWVSLIADGKPVAHETLIAPAHISARATHEIVVKAGNAAGISFLLNGKEIPAQGNEGEVKTYIFNATGLQTQ
jgi:hypothetical protein